MILIPDDMDNFLSISKIRFLKNNPSNDTYAEFASFQFMAFLFHQSKDAITISTIQYETSIKAIQLSCQVKIHFSDFLFFWAHLGPYIAKWVRPKRLSVICIFILLVKNQIWRCCNLAFSKLISIAETYLVHIVIDVVLFV